MIRSALPGAPSRDLAALLPSPGAAPRSGLPVALGAALVLALAVLAGCSSLRSDGPPASPPPGLAQVPDADPRLEPIRDGGPNKPYQALGKLYTPIRADLPFNERGLASWYGTKFQGKRTASGEPYDMYAMTAAHRTMPIPSYARVRNPKNGREIVVRINDRGPFHSDRVIDLSYTAALKLGVLNGVQPVELTRITFDDIRTGAWRRPGTTDGLVNVASVDGGSTAAGPASVRPVLPSPPMPAAGTSGLPVPAATLPSGLVPVETAPMAAGVGAASASPGVFDKSLPAGAGSPGVADRRSPAGATSPGVGVSSTASASLPVPVPVPVPVPMASGPGPTAPPAGNAATSPVAVDAGSTLPAAAGTVVTSADPAASSASSAAPDARPSPTAGAAGFWVQLGAFRQRAGAEAFHRKVAADLAWLMPVLSVGDDKGLYRLQAGPYADRDAAQGVAQRIRDSLRLVPVIVDRR